jgi:conjugative transposon TraJ protein
MKWKFLTIMAVTGLLPLFSHAQGVADNIHGLQGTLDNIYNEMLPMCSQLIGVARGIAGFAALWYIAARVYRQIASAEPIDFYPLLRPFALGMAILMFPVVISVINGIMQPVVPATGSMVKNSDQAITKLLQQKEEALKNTAEWQMYTGTQVTEAKINGINTRILTIRPEKIIMDYPE